MGPPPKPAAARRRRNKAPASRKLGAQQGKQPTLGMLRGKRPVTATREWWRTIWASPMASAWVEADVPALRRLAGLLDGYARSGSRDLLPEIRHLEDRFGLSPLARLRLQWEVEDPVTAAASGEAAPAVEDQGRFLRAIEGGAAWTCGGR